MRNAEKKLEKILDRMSELSKDKCSYTIRKQINHNFPDHEDVRLKIFIGDVLIYKQNQLVEKSKLSMDSKTFEYDTSETQNSLCESAIVDLCLYGALQYKHQLEGPEQPKEDVSEDISWLRLEYNKKTEGTSYTGGVSPFTAVAMLNDALMIFKSKRIDEINSDEGKV